MLSNKNKKRKRNIKKSNRARLIYLTTNLQLTISMIKMKNPILQTFYQS